MNDPLNEYFDVPAVGTPSEDNPAPARPIENQAITEDVQLTRKALQGAIREASTNLPAIFSLALQMQEAEMIDSASKMMTALAKVSVDLINIDLRVLQESKKVVNTSPVAGGSDVPEPSLPAQTTTDVIKAIKALRAAERHKEAEDAKTRAETVEVKD